MIVHGAIAPPRAALEELLDRVAAIESAPPVEPAQHGFLRRRTTAVSAAPEAAVDIHPVGSIHLRVAGFGNLTTGDVLSLTQALKAAAAAWTAPRVFFAGGAFVPGERQIWATLQGDLDGLNAVARSVGMSVERLGLFVDRRKFQPSVEIGIARPSATDSDIARVIDVLNGFRGQEWTVGGLELLTQTFDGPRSDWRQLELIGMGQR